MPNKVKKRFSILLLAMLAMTGSGWGNPAWAAFITSGSSQWSNTAGGIYYGGGNVGVGTSTPTEALEVNGKLKIGNNTVSGENVTFDGSTAGGMRVTNPYGYVNITPLNNGWAHFYTDRGNFIFNKPVWTIGGGGFSSYYNEDLVLKTGGTTRLTINNVSGNIGIGTTNTSARLYLNGGTGNVVNIGGGQIAGLNSTPVNTDQAVPLGYLQSNYVPIGSGSGGIGSGTSGQTLRHNGTSWVANSILYNNGTNVGIGMTNPRTKAHIWTGEVSGGQQESLRLEGNWVSNPSGPLLRFTNQHDSGTNPNSGEYNLAGIQGVDDTGNWGGSLAFFTTPSGTAGGGNLAERMRITNNGNVGIGITNPLAKMHVNGGSFRISSSTNQFATLYMDGNGVYFEGAGDTAATNRIRFQNSNRGGAATYNGFMIGENAVGSGSGIQFYTGGYNNNRMVINETGNVGIGNTNPTSKLLVGSTSDTADNVIRVTGGDAYNQGFEAYGNSQGTGYLFVGQSNTYGGGLFYNGDGTPVFATGESADSIGFYRMSSGAKEVVFSYPYSSNAVTFRGSIAATGAAISGGTGNVVTVGGGQIAGLNSTPINSDQAVPLGYLQNNYVPLGSGSGGVGSGTSGQTLRHNGTSWVANSALFNNGTNVGIGTTNSLHRLQISGDNSSLPTDARFAVVKNEEGYGLFMGIEGSGNSWLQSSTRNNATKYRLTIQPQGGDTILNPLSGNVGIGTTAPAYNLDVRSGVTGNITVGSLNTATTNGTDIGAINFFNSDAEQAGIAAQIKSIRGSSYGSGGLLTFSTSQTGSPAGALTEYMRITTAGNVGIGITNPSAKLYVGGGTGNVLNVGGGQIAGLNSTPVNTDQAVPLGYLQSNYVPIGSGSGGVGSGTSGQTLRHNGTSWVANSVLYNNGTNVGIGTSNPLSKLNIYGSSDGLKVTGSGNNFIELRSSGNNALYIDFAPNSTSDSGYGTPDYPGRIIYNSVANSLQLLANGQGVTINSNGNVGVGTTSPITKLAVSGGTGDVINAGGGYVAGLNSTPINADQAVPLGYLQSNYAPVGSATGSAFVQGGNSFGANAIFGAKDNYAVGFYTNDQERMRLTNGGNLALGASDTGVRLHVESPSGPVAFFKSTINSGNYSGYIGNGQTISGEEFGLYYALNDARLAVYDVTSSNLVYGNSLFINTNTANVGIGTTNPGAKLNITGPATSVGLKIRSGGNSGINLVDIGDVNGAGPFVINALGNVGIGTTNPTTPLTVGPNPVAAFNSSELFQLAKNGDAYMTISDGSGRFLLGTTGGLPFVGTQNATDFVFRTSNLERVRVKSSGNVGIGTTNPTVKLYVNGGTGNVLNVGGGQIAGLNSTPVNTDQAVPLGYLQSNYVPIGSGSGGIGSGTSGQTLRHNGTSWVANSTLYNNGTNIGIGTTTPGEKMDIGGGHSNTRVRLYATGFGQPAASNDAFLSLWASEPGQTYTGVGIGNNIWNSGVDPFDFTRYNTARGGSYIRLLDNAISANVVNSSGAPTTALYVNGLGNVGIGTTNPSSRLHSYNYSSDTVTGRTNIIDVLTLETTNTASAPYRGFGQGIEFRGRTYQNSAVRTLGRIATVLTDDSSTNTGTSIVFQNVADSATVTSPVERMRISYDGNVGIGTTNPTVKLYVNGGTGNVLNVGGGQIAGLNSTPVNTDQAVPLGYLQSNYVPIGSGSGGIGSGTSGQTLRHNGTSWVANSTLFNNGTNVGIGTTVPNKPLMVVGSNNSESPAFPKILSVADSSDATKSISLGYSSSWDAGVIQSIDDGTSWKNTVINPNGGNVGIGVTNPGSLLQIGNDATNPTLILESTSAGDETTVQSAGIEFGEVPSARGSIWYTGNGYMHIGMNNRALEYMRFSYNTNSTWMYGSIYFPGSGIWNSSGNIGVGTTNPSVKLYVNGGTGNAINAGGGQVSGLNSTPVNADQAVPLGYLQANYTPSSASFVQGGNSFGGIATLGTNDPYNLNFETNNNTRLTITNGGNVGIGTTNPGNYRLKIAGNMAVTGTFETQTGSDFAEEFRTDRNLEPGTVVSMGDLGYKSVKVSSRSYDKTVVGIVSDSPSMIAGKVEVKEGESKVIVAMAGVVSVKVNDENGPIERGDLLVSSSFGGYAMRAGSDSRGAVIGKALEDFTGRKGTIKVLVNLQ